MKHMRNVTVLSESSRKNWHINNQIRSPKIPDNYMEDLCADIRVGDRCQVEPGVKRGVVKFVGQAETLAPGFWVGIQYDEPLGKHDGMVKGKRYFQCPPLFGGMVRPDKVKVCAQQVNYFFSCRNFFILVPC